MEDALGGTECILSKKNLNNGVKRILQVCETPPLYWLALILLLGRRPVKATPLRLATRSLL